jgi:5-(carboxyamino)imidazole ribonucleotide synthase
MSNTPILPPATLGVLGGGQLGMYFALAARRLGYRVMVLDPDASCPAARAADHHLVAKYDDAHALAEMASACAAVTCEFENVPALSLRALAVSTRVAPAASAVAIAQDRIAEKRFLNALGLATAPFEVMETARDLEAATLFPGLLKRSREGYDGKGQITVHNAHELVAAWHTLGQVPCVLEAKLVIDREVSVVLARGHDGSIERFPISENQHRDGILDISIVPARVNRTVRAIACKWAERIAEALDYTGVLAVEFFVHDDQLRVNEIAPRPHNSGHYTLDACDVSQFEQQVRALTGLPLASPRLLASAVMVNLMGDHWRPVPAWEKLHLVPGTRLHLYGKTEARPGRKMGHVTVLARNTADALRWAGTLPMRRRSSRPDKPRAPSDHPTKSAPALQA